MLDLLAEPLLHTQSGSLSLTQTLARLSTGEALIFNRLRCHQQPAWHAFLVQLGYHALDVASSDSTPCEAEPWRDLLLNLTQGRPEPWQLVVDDWQQPAFLQPPCLLGHEVDYRGAADSIQALDLLVTSKNFDEKAEKGRPPSREMADSLVYALVTLQGWAPFQGAGNYSTMRMNGGFSARSQFRLVQSRGSGAEWHRDVMALLAQRSAFMQPSEPGDIGTGRALRLLWLEPWGENPLPVADAHPLALEVCRRVRLRGNAEEGISIQRAGSKSMRVDAKAHLGSVRDPWLPLILDDGLPKALTANRDALGYKRLSTLLFDTSVCQMPLLARPAPSDDPRVGNTLVAQVLVGGQGASDGLLRRELPLPAKALGLMLRGEARLPLRAQSQLKDAGTAWGKCLRSALIQYLDGSGNVAWKHGDFDRMASSWASRWDAEVDSVFFSHLFSSVDLDDHSAREVWLKLLSEIALPMFDAAIAALPTRSSSPLMAASRAARLLHNGWRKHLGQAMHARHDASHEEHARP